jgi:hypothetical protein
MGIAALNPSYKRCADVSVRERSEVIPQKRVVRAVRNAT